MGWDGGLQYILATVPRQAPVLPHTEAAPGPYNYYTDASERRCSPPPKDPADRRDGVLPIEGCAEPPPLLREGGLLPTAPWKRGCRSSHLAESLSAGILLLQVGR